MTIRDLIWQLRDYDRDTEVLIDKDDNIDFLVEKEGEAVSLNTFER